MLNYKEQIEQMTISEKIALLTGDPRRLAAVGPLPPVPHLGVADLWASNAEGRGAIFPSPASLANSFDPSLFAAVAEQLALRGEAMGNNLFILPDSKSPFDVYGRGLSEDPLVVGQMLGGCAEALKSRGYGVALHAPALFNKDVESLGGEVDERTIYDRVARPYREILEKGVCHAVMVPERELDDAYVGIDDSMMRRAIPQDAEIIATGIEADHAVQALLEDKMLLDIEPESIEAALENYRAIRHSIEEGASTVEELHAAMKDGSAISEEQLDEVLDRRLRLGARCRQPDGEMMVDRATLESVALRAARQSIVMLKNEDDILPLSRSTKIAVIGDAIADGDDSEFTGFVKDFAVSLRHKRIVGCARGYRLSKDRSEKLIPEAVSLARRADATVLFLGLGKTREAMIPDMHSLELPANQLALFDALSKTRKPIIVVVVGSRAPAMGFDRRAHATLLMPAQGIKVAQALADVIEGRANPGGKLAYSGTDNPDLDYRADVTHMKEGMKTGPFIGYRRSVSEGIIDKYAFGYGLTFGEVTYSKVRVIGNHVRVRLHNRTHAIAYETVQVYLGLKNSSVLRPRRELKGMKTVAIRPGKHVDVDIPIRWCDIWMPNKKKCVIETGTYRLAVVGSNGYVHAVEKVPLSGHTIQRENFTLSDYLRSAATTGTNSYTMEGYCKPMKTRAVMKTTSILLILLTLFADVLYTTCALLDFIRLEETIWIVLGTSAGLIGLGAVLFIVWAIMNAVAKRRQRALEREATAELFMDAEQVTTSSLESLFVEEFDIPEQRTRQEQVTYTERDEERFAYVNLDVDMPTTADRMQRFFRERGMELSAGMVRSVLSAMMTSRLLVFRSNVKWLTENFTYTLGLFFGTETYTSSFAGYSAGENTLLTLKAVNGTTSPSGVMSSVKVAESHKDKVHFASITDVAFADAGAFLTPYIRYFSNPQNGCKVKEPHETVQIPTNLWFVLNARNGDSLENLEPFIANFAAVVDLQVELVAEAAEKTPNKALTCTEVDALIYRARKASEVDENLWKLVDRMESYINDRVPYHIGNKLYLQMECFLAVYGGCGGDAHDGMDSAIAAKLLPAIINRQTELQREDDVEFREVMSNIFGEEHITVCRYMLKNPALEWEEPETPAEEAPVAEESIVVDEAPATEEIAVAEETPVVEEAPATEETPIVEETPAAEEVPAVEEIPVSEEVPVTEETPAEETPATEEPSVEETPAVTEESPVETSAEETPATEEPLPETTSDEAEVNVTDMPAEDAPEAPTAPQMTVRKAKPRAELKPKKPKAPKVSTRKSSLAKPEAETETTGEVTSDAE